MGGLITFGCIMMYNLNYPQFISNHIYRITYLLRALVFLPTLMAVYKRCLPALYGAYPQIYTSYSILSIICIVYGLFVKTKFWNYILDGCFVSPLIEELIARFVLYEARNRGVKVYALVAIITSLSFGLMHFGYASSFPTKSIILPKLRSHSVFSLILCSVFWFFPRLSLLITIHAFSNLISILAHAAELF